MALHTVPEVAKRWNLSESAVRAAIRMGTIPAVRLGRGVRVASETVEALERVGLPLLTKRPNVQTSLRG